MQKTIFVAGIHGVGKTYLCESIANLGLIFASASQIIKRELIDKNWSKEKIVSEADKNQVALICGVEKIKKSHKSNDLLLDGHFVLRTQNDFFLVDQSVFKVLNLDAVILIEDDVEIIAARLEARDSVAAPKDLAKFLRLEREQAKKFTSDNRKPLYFIKSGDVSKFSEVINEILGADKDYAG